MRKMRYYTQNKLDQITQRMVLKAMQYKYRGESHIMSVVLIMIVVLGVVLLFRDNITELVNKLFEKVNDFSKDL